MGAKAKRSSKTKSNNVGAEAAGNASSSKGDVERPAQGPKRRQLGRRDSSEKVERQLRTHFAGMSRMEMSNKLVDGKNVRQRVAADREEHKSSGKHRMGATYWRDLASRYGVGADFSSLELKDDKSVSRKSLIDCLQLAVSPNCAARDGDAFAAYLANVNDLSAKELLGVAKTLSASQGIGRRASDKLWSDLGNYLVKTGFQHTTAEFRSMFRKVIDQVMERTYLHLRKNHVRLQTFMTTYDGMLRWIFEPKDYDVVSSCGERWTTCIPQLQRLAKHSDLGETMYSFVYELLNAEALSQCLEARLKEFQFEMVTEQTFAELQAGLMEDVNAFRESKALFSRRLVVMDFLGAKITIQVMSPTSEMHLRLHGKIKEYLIASEGGIAPMLHESWVPFHGGLRRCLWDEILLRPFHKARALASEMLEPSCLKCTADIAKILGGAREVLLQLDSSFSLELAWAEQEVRFIVMYGHACRPRLSAWRWPLPWRSWRHCKHL